jgi:hypothetical protein
MDQLPLGYSFDNLASGSVQFVCYKNVAELCPAISLIVLVICA